MDKHLKIIAYEHPECVFVSLNVEKVKFYLIKAPFFVKKL